MSHFTSQWMAEYNAKRSLTHRTEMAKEIINRPNYLKEGFWSNKSSETVKKAVQVKLPRKESKLEHDFEALWKRLDGPKLEREFRFHEKRRFRFDFAVLENSVAIEIDGCVWQQGRHTRGAGFISDCVKLNLAGLAGWKVFRLTKEMITKENVMPIIELCRKQTKLLEELGI